MAILLGDDLHFIRAACLLREYESSIQTRPTHEKLLLYALHTRVGYKPMPAKRTLVGTCILS